MVERADLTDRYGIVMTLKAIIISLFLVSGMIGSAAGADTIPADSGRSGIDTIVIRNQNIFSSDSAEQFFLYRLANGLHIKTRASIIRRELLQGEGEMFSRVLADETERNLRALPYIWDARVSLEKIDGDRQAMVVTTSDRWTLAGGPTFSRLYGQTVYQLGVEELNLLGYGQQLKFDYFFREYEDDYSEWSFLERRLLGSRYRLSAYYNGDPEVGMKSVGLTYPLYSLNSRLGYSVGWSDFDRQEKYYLSGYEVARNQARGRRLQLSGVYRFGSYNGKVSLGLNYRYQDIRISDRTLFYQGVSVAFPEDSLYHSILPSLGISFFEFHQTRHINTFSKTEDITVGLSSAATLGWHYDASSGELLHRSVAFSVAYSGLAAGHLFSGGISRGYWFKGRSRFRETFSLSMKYYNNRCLWWTPVLAVVYSEDFRSDGREGLYLGENYGIRGYPKNYSNGEKKVRLNLENRFFTGLRLFSAEFGLAQFVDLGQTWTRSAEFKTRNNLWSVGAGLRIGTEKVSNAELVRIDLAYAGRIKNWELSFGVGQYF